MDPRDLNEALERELYHTHSAGEITAKFLGRDRMEHIGHFPTSMEMCRDDRLPLITEKTQQKQFQCKASEQCCSAHSISLDSQKNTVLSHAEFTPGMESMPFFPGNQFLQGKKKSTLGTKLKPFMDTCTFTLDTDQKTSTSSKVTHKKGRMTATVSITTMTGITLRTVNMITTHILMSSQPQDSFSNKLDQLRKSTVQDNQLTRLSLYINTGFPCDNKSLLTDLHEFWNHRETLSTESRITVMMNITMSTVHMITTQCLMSEHSSDSISNRIAQPGKNTSQKKHITRLEDHNNIDQLCDRENLPTDLLEAWPYKEPLHNRSGLINYGDKIVTVMCQYIHKAMTQGKFQYMQKVVYILSRPFELQPMLPDCGTPPLQPMANYSIASPLQLITQHTPREKDLPQLPSTLGAQEMYQTHQELIRRQQNKLEKSYIELTPGTSVWVQHRQNTSWEPAMVVSQCITNSYWIMQENGT